MRATVIGALLILFIGLASIEAEIIDVHDNEPSETKFGVMQEHPHPRCAQRAHSSSAAPLAPLAQGEYDFIVVGGGSAGNVIAARLAELSANVTVLLLESGKNVVDDAEVMAESLKELMKVDYCVPGQTADKCSLLSLPIHFSETPFLTPYLSMSNHSYYYQTVPQLFSNKREIKYPRGNLLGGSSATNNMIYFRGHPEDYNQWADLGLAGWSYNDLLPYMRKIETNHDYADKYSEAHGSDGPIHTFNSSGLFQFPVADALIKVAHEKMGYPLVDDFNKGFDYYGVGYWQQYSNDKGRRTSSYEYIRRLIKQNRVCIDGFIATVSEQDPDLKVPDNSNSKHPKSEKQPCTSAQNLVILTQSLATRLLYDTSDTRTGSKPRVAGIRYVNTTEHPHLAHRLFKNEESFDNEEQKSRQGQQYWDPEDRPEVYNCPVSQTLAFDNKRQGEWYIPPDTAHGIPESAYKQVFAKREVILSAGAINTPQLLMLSGIGPASDLEHNLNFKPKNKQAGAPIDNSEDRVIMDLPGVGSRALDHEEVTVSFKLPKSAQHWGIAKDLLSETNKWVEGKPSALASNHAPAGMDISSDGPNGTTPTIHLHFLMIYLENLDYNMWLNQDAAHRFPSGMTDFMRYEGLQHYTVLIERSGTCSHGSVKLRNKNPLIAPFVDLAYGTCRFTLEELVFGIRETRKMNALLPEDMRGEEVLPGVEYQTDDELQNWVRNMVWGHHISGTAPMGSCKDKHAVLDGHGRVFGVEGLRVADASSFPTIPHGNILYSTYIVAERIVDFIIKDNKLA